jgi:TrmH family RNA methyltransferase
MFILSLVACLRGGPVSESSLIITSGQNPKVKDIVRLRQRRHRDNTGRFLIEGYRELSRAASSGLPIEILYICSDLFLGSNEQYLIAEIEEKGAQIIPCTESVFQKISYRDRPDGLLAVAKQMEAGLASLVLSEAPFFVLAEAIEKPGNLGTILRSSDAVGVDGVIVCDRCTDIHNPNVVRASVGTLFTIPVVEADGEDTLSWLQANGIAIVAATPDAKEEFTDVDLRGPIAIAVGTEQLGLSPRLMEKATIHVRIPMCGVADSLNVAMATTLCLYEALRQRRKA